MDHFIYATDDMVCSSRIEIEIDGGIVRKAEFTGGCPGNLIAVNKLVQGRPVGEVVKLLKGIRCGGKPTSCADQLATALQLYMNKKGMK